MGDSKECYLDSDQIVKALIVVITIINTFFQLHIIKLKYIILILKLNAESEI